MSEWPDKLPEIPMNDFSNASNSAIKIIKNTKGINLEVKIVAGQESLIDSLKEKAVKIYSELEAELGE